MTPPAPSLSTRFLALAGASLLALPAGAAAEAQVEIGHHPTGAGFALDPVPPPARNDAATGAKFALTAGSRDRNCGDLDVLHDSRLPTNEDQPSANFFFRAGSEGGRIEIDLGSAIEVERVSTYSWHRSSRGPQVYTLFGADGTAPDFKGGTDVASDPTSTGWTRIAQVDTRPPDGDGGGGGDGGGQYAVAITGGSGALGTFRYLLFAVEPTDTRDAFGHTFFSEIDVIDADHPAPEAIDTAPSEPVRIAFDAQDGRFRFTIDATAAPELATWAEEELKPVVQEWYPKVVALLPGDAFEPPAEVTLRFRTDMGGTPASASGAGINMNAPWIARELEREAKGAVVHELVHVVQSYGRRRGAGATRPPGWLVEGIADYIRWFLYEPESLGAEITAANFLRARYDASYRITANFLNWVTDTYGSEIVPTLNTALREGSYTEDFWKEATGRSVQELGTDWKAAQKDILDAKI
ncbi:hypothetical protein BH23VER1_BH23VER1_27990 [soil metagenome]